MPRLARPILWVMAAVLAMLFLFAIRRVLLGKYRPGMTIEQAQRRMGKSYEAMPSSQLYVQPPSPRELQQDEAFAIYVQDENIVLYFNHHRRLVRIDRQGEIE